MLYKKRVLACLVFLFGLLVLLSVSSRIFIPKNNTAECGMEYVSANGILGEDPDTVDVIVIGDSEAYNSVIPMQIWKENGYTSYVCATSGQTLDYSMTMLLRALKHQKPKIVILETDAIYRKMNFTNAVTTKLADYFTIFHYHDRWKTLTKNDLNGDVVYSWTDDRKGYIYNDKVNPWEKTDYMKPEETVAQIPELNRQYVQGIKNLCEQNGAKLILLSTPSPVNWSFKRHNGILPLAEEMKCEYIDLNLLNKEINIDWKKDTRDKGDHLNHSGAVKVTHYLAGYLKQTKLLEDHREDPKYSKWHESLKKYEMSVSTKGT